VQAKVDGVDIQESPARHYGDWRCGDCKLWWSDFRPNCGRCTKKAEDCKDAVDYNDELGHPPEYYMDSSKDCWTGGVEPKGNPHASNAAYLGVKGRFKEKKNPYKPRDWCISCFFLFFLSCIIACTMYSCIITSIMYSYM
jgi:hypothetical protein